MNQQIGEASQNTAEIPDVRLFQSNQHCQLFTGFQESMRPNVVQEGGSVFIFDLITRTPFNSWTYLSSSGEVCRERKWVLYCQVLKHFVTSYATDSLEYEANSYIMKFKQTASYITIKRDKDLHERSLQRTQFITSSLSIDRFAEGLVLLRWQSDHFYWARTGQHCYISSTWPIVPR